MTSSNFKSHIPLYGNLWNRTDIWILVARVYEILKHFGCSSYDIGTDVGNSIGYFLGNNLNDSFVCNGTICYDNSIGPTDLGKKHYEESSAKHKEWAYIIIFLIFLPGLLWACRPKAGRANIRRLYGLIFPFYTIGYGFWALLNPYPKTNATEKATKEHQKKVQNRLLLICTFEAFFESYPQIIIAIYSLSFQDTKITTIQTFGIFGSVFFVAYAIISFDIAASDVELSSLVDKVKYLLKVLPLYGFGTLFRVISLSLTIIYLRWLSIIPIFILMIEMVITVGTIMFGPNCLDWDWDIIYHMALTNINAATVGMIRIRYIEEQRQDEQPRNAPEEVQSSQTRIRNLSLRRVASYDVNKDVDIENKCRRFLTISQYVTLVHHLLVLSTILTIIRWPTYRNNLNELNEMLNLGSNSGIEELEYFLQPNYQWNGVAAVYIIFSSVFMIGFIDVLIVSCMSRHVRFKPKKDEENGEAKESEVDGKTELGEFNDQNSRLDEEKDEVVEKDIESKTTLEQIKDNTLLTDEQNSKAKEDRKDSKTSLEEFAAYSL